MELLSPSDVVTGQFYDVPCVGYEDYQSTSQGIKKLFRIVPVLLPDHIDKVEDGLKSLPRHYHIDFRFQKEQSKNDGFCQPRLENECVNAVFTSHVTEKPFYQKMEALNEEKISSLQNVGFVARYQETYPEEKAVKGICPHQGAALLKCGTCPMHGLKWKPETGEYKYKPPFKLKIMPDGPFID